MVLKGFSVWHCGAQSDALVTSLHLLALLCFASYAKTCRRSKTRAYLFSACSARLQLVPLVGYMVEFWRRYDDVHPREDSGCNASASLKARWGERSGIQLPIALCAWSNFSTIVASPLSSACVRLEKSEYGSFIAVLNIAQVASLTTISSVGIGPPALPVSLSAWAGFRRIDRFTAAARSHLQATGV